MRRSVFLAVWLGLVLSLLKETAAETPADTAVMPASIPAEDGSGNDTATDPLPVPTSEPAEDGSGNDTAPDPPQVPTSKPAGNDTGNDTATDPLPVPTSEPAGNDTGNDTATAPTQVPTSEPAGNGTGNGTDPDATEMPTLKPAVDFCSGYPCGRNLATCVSLQSNYTCECQYGFYYSNENCYRGQVFPATIGVKALHSNQLQFVNSTEYEELFHNVSAFFKKALGNLSGYIETVIVEIQSQTQTRTSNLLNVTVTNLFMWNSTENATTVDSAVQRAIENDNYSYVYAYNVAKHCDVYECDTKTTVCEGDDFPECKCKPDFERTDWDVRSCSACSKTCSAEAHKYCVKEGEVPTCKCMTDYKMEAGSCVPCPVGFSGEECRDNTELILIIVGTVLGAIILSLVIAVSIISVRAKHKQNPEKRSLIKPEYSDMKTSDDRPSMFPRVQTTSGHANPGYQPNNPYEMHSTNRDHFPERDYDDLYETSREPRGFRTQSRY